MNENDATASFTLRKDHDGDSKRLDYIFYESNDNYQCTFSKVVLKGHKSKDFLSDHYAVEAAFSISEENKRRFNLFFELFVFTSSFLLSFF